MSLSGEHRIYFHADLQSFRSTDQTHLSQSCFFICVILCKIMKFLITQCWKSTIFKQRIWWSSFNIEKEITTVDTINNNISDSFLLPECAPYPGWVLTNISELLSCVTQVFCYYRRGKSVLYPSSQVVFRFDILTYFTLTMIKEN